MAPTLSRILAFDLFIHNDDRHLKNYIVRQQRSGISLLAFDYSRAWLWHGFPPPELPLSPCNTIYAHRYLRDRFGNFLVEEDIDHVLNAIKQINTAQVEGLILEQPGEWLTNERRDAILSWWNSDNRIARIAQIKEGMANGSFL